MNDIYTHTLTMCMVFSFLAVSRSLFLEYPVSVPTHMLGNTYQILHKQTSRYRKKGNLPDIPKTDFEIPLKRKI